MLARSSKFFVVAPLGMVILSLGCIGDSVSEIIVDLPEIEEYQPPVPENTLVISVTTDRSRDLGFTVYAGKELDPESRFEAQTKNELTELIACHIENMTASNPALDTVLIECDGNVRGGDVEIVKSGVCQSSGQSTRKLFLGIRDEAKITDDN